MEEVTKADVLFVPRNRSEAESWLRQCVRYCAGGFHPDTPGDDYVNEDGEATFTKAEVKVFEKARSKVFELLDDPYEVGLQFVAELNHQD